MILKYNHKTEKSIKCSTGCGRDIIVPKFSSNNKSCPKCEKAKADKGPKITPIRVTQTDMAREAVTGTPANPRANLTAVHDALIAHGFSIMPDHTWCLVVSEPNDGPMSRMTVYINNGMPSMPDPHISHIQVTTQHTLSLTPDVARHSPTPEVGKILSRIYETLDRGAKNSKHTITRICDKCKAPSPEYIIMHDKTYCISCSGVRKRQ